MTTILVAPAQGRRVVTPQGTLVPAKFMVDPRDPYWARALRAADIVRADETPGAQDVAPTASAAANTPAPATLQTSTTSVAEKK